MKKAIFSTLFVTLFVLHGCTEKKNGENKQQNTKADAQSGIANPASAFCEDKGGSIDIREDEQGNEYGVCLFSNGKECDEWDYFRGECGPNSASDAATEKDALAGDAGINPGNPDSSAVDAATEKDAIASEAGVVPTNPDSSAVDAEAEKDAIASDTGTGIANPASVACVDAGGTLEIRNSAEGQFGVCNFSSGAKCEEWALLRDECSAEAPNFCETAADCACGKNTTTNDCFVGQKEFVDTAQQCPDFCTGIGGNLRLKCTDYKCSVGM
jgi:uncharacterized protein